MARLTLEGLRHQVQDTLRAFDRGDIDHADATNVIMEGVGRLEDPEVTHEVHCPAHPSIAECICGSVE